MNKDDILKYLQDLNDELLIRNVKGELCMVEGAVMCICFMSRISTMDVDAIFEPKTLIYECAGIVAMKNSLPKDWLNDGVKGFLSTEKDFRSYKEMSNLHVYVASPEYMLAMKCLSARLENANEVHMPHFRQTKANVPVMEKNQKPPKYYKFSGAFI